MEVVLLWLDDLDDLVFGLALKWEQLRRAVLRVGLLAALAVATCELSLIATELTPALSVVRGHERRGLVRSAPPCALPITVNYPPSGQGRLKKLARRLT